MTEPVLLRGAKDIARVGKFSHKKLENMVKFEGVPAFKRNGKGPWLAVPEDMRKWAKLQRDKYLFRGKNRCQ